MTTSPPPASEAPQTPGTVTVIPLAGIAEVRGEDSLAALLTAALERAGVRWMAGDILVVSSKVISKAAGLRVPDSSPEHRQQVVLSQSHRVVAERSTPTGVTRVVESVAGPVMAAAGIDASNTGPDGGLLLLPADADLAARDLYAQLLTAAAPAPLPPIGIVISDTSGRPWRLGQVDFALGSFGVRALDDLRGGVDSDGRDLSVTARAVADEIAAAADLVKGKVHAIPAAVVRGLPPADTISLHAPGARNLVRTGPSDWFRYAAAEAVRAALGVEPGTAVAQQVGIASVLPEDAADRLQRAIAVATLGDGCAPGCVTGEVVRGPDPRGEDLGQVICVVHCQDRYRAGRTVARLEVALHGEQLRGSVSAIPAAPADAPEAPSEGPASAP